MKNPSSFFLAVMACIFAACSFCACSSLEKVDIQKRHYRKGFYVSRKPVSSSEKSIQPIAENVFIACKNPVDSSPKENPLLADEQKEIAFDSTRKIPSAQKRDQPEIKKEKSAILENKPGFKSIQRHTANVPEWLSSTAYVLLFTLVCFIVPPYFFFFLGIIYILAKNKKKATFLLLTGIVDTIGFALVIALLIAGSPLLLPVYLATVGLGLIGLAFVLIRFFTL
jgi:hypothetical protein